MPRRCAGVVLVALGLASAAQAAVSVDLSANSNVTGPGYTITLTVRVTADAGEMDNAVFGAVNYDQTVVNVGVRSQNLLPNGPWNPGALNCTTVFCVLFSQVRPAGVASVGVTDFVIATATFTVELDNPSGTVIQFVWRTSPTTQRLDFFGITNAPGISITEAIPEPTTAALLGAGLLGLAVARGRRRAGRGLAPR